MAAFVTAAVSSVPGVASVDLSFGVMNDEQRAQVRRGLRGDAPEREIPFAQPGSKTRVYAVASGKGGVGKTTVATCLGLTLAENRGDRAVVLDANPDAGTLADRLTAEMVASARRGGFATPAVPSPSAPPSDPSGAPAP